MNTPRLRSAGAWPSTPRTGQDAPTPNASASGRRVGISPLPNAPALSKASDDAPAPIIPFTVVDAPSQRLYVSFFYIGLTVWRLCDYLSLVTDETDSLWLFMKWVAIDSIFLYGLPGLKIPWLEWSSSTMTALFILHAFMNALLMFRIPIPLESWLIALTKTMYDRELSVSERRVKPASILHNSSLILGKQIIHILPEGSAELNPDQSSFCIGDSRTSIGLPIRVNQTNPILIELLRIDLETNTNETITITKKEISKLKRQTEKNVGKVDTSGSQRFKFPVKRTGLYRLQKVIDESKLEVQRRLSDTLVVGCPVVLVKPVPSDKCKGELSNFYFQVDATPPLKVKYSKTINRKDHGLAFLSIQSEDLDSPLARQRTSGALVTIDASADIDVSWARTQSTRIPMNETLGTSGGWQYSIEEVHDACGNVANYSKPGLEDFGQYRPSRKSSVEQTFLVHERPKVTLDGHDLQKPLNAPQGKSRQLPVQFSSTGPKEIEGSIYTLTYLFTPQKQVLPSGEHANNATVKTIVIENRRELDINEPGLYTLSSVSTEFCGGEVLEPSSFMLLNPPEPDLTISAENIPDKCAGNSIGLLVDLDLIGTPPFRVSYSIRREGGHVTPKVEKINRLRTQLELRPLDAGHYIYEFVDIGDAVYDIRSLKHNNLILEQDVKPPASARFADWWPPQREACIEEPVTVNIQLTGEAPWTLEYELVHGGSRRKHRVDDIKKEYYGLVTEELTDGGDYTLALTSVTDRSGCKIFLEQELKIEVRRQRPKASFGQLEGKRNILALEARKVKLPLRLIGEPPWTITYRNLDKAKEKISTQVLHHNNDFIEVGEQGTYEIINVKDVICPGTVELSANQFEVRWIPRPTLNVVQSVTVESQGDKYEKKGVCEDDEDAVEISLTGTPPYDVKYEQHLKPDHGSSSMSRKELVAGLGGASLKMETSQSGLYEYSFSELGDYFYDHDRRKSSPVLVQQRVYPRPSARFVGVGKTYSYCKEEDMGAEVLPIALVGVAPFHLDIEIRHHGTTKPNSMSVPNVETNLYNLRIPRRMLALGVHTVTIRKVQDARGCLRKSEFDASHVQVDVADNPSISPVEAQTDYCVGDRISYTLSGTPPFDVFYTFRGVDRKASVSSADFRRIAEFPGDFTIMAISDHKSTDACKARVKITKTIHEMPSVRISKGRVATVDIHEGGKADVLFEFGGTPPFEFTYTRSTNAHKGRKSEILETKNDVSDGHSKTIRLSDEGTYEVVAIRDRFCAFSTQNVPGKAAQKLLTYR